MNVGLFSLVDHDASRRGADAELLRDQVDQAVRADRLGLDSFWIAEHHASEYGAIIPCNAVLAGAIASRTESIRIGAGAALLTLHDPVEIAEQWAMVDCLSSGRLDFGVARAFLPAEFELFGVDMEESRARFDAALELIEHLWSGRSVGFDGPFRRVPDVGPLTPLPVQTPRPPIWVAAAMSPESFRAAGERGHRLMVAPYASGLENMAPLIEDYYEAYDAAGHSPENRRVQMAVHLLLADDTDTARRLIVPALDRYMQTFANAVRLRAFESEAYAHYGQVLKHIGAITGELLLGLDRVVAGTPDDALEVMSRYLDMVPLTDIAFMVDFGLLEREHVHHTIDLLGRKLAPALRA